MDKNERINREGFYDKLSNLLSHNIDYIWMAVFSRIYFLKRIFLHLSRSNSVNKPDLKEMRFGDVVELMAGVTAEEILSDLHKEGCSPKLKLSGKTASEMISNAHKIPCYAYGDPKKGFRLEDKCSYEEYLGTDILLAKYLNFQNKDVFKDFRHSDLLRDIAKNYLGNSAECIATQLWWTFPADVDDSTRSEAAHFFHRDVDAWGFVKFFFYLSNVSEGGGAHVYVKRSHKPSTLKQIFYEKLRINRHHDCSIKKHFGCESITPFYGPIGMGIAADTFGFHKGESPEKNPRLMLCAVYASKDYGVQDFNIDPKELGDVFGQ